MTDRKRGKRRGGGSQRFLKLRWHFHVLPCGFAYRKRRGEENRRFSGAQGRKTEKRKKRRVLKG